MGDLSKNFSRSEFECSCCGESLMDNALIIGLQELRDMVGLPIYINSGFRCPAHNTEVGGALDGQHPLGKATDITIPALSVLEMYVKAERIYVFRNGGIGIYPNFIHVDTRDSYARWGQIDNKYVSFITALTYIGRRGLLT